MKALSIRQPWAWLIVNGYKDVENRDWPTLVRGLVLIHAGKEMSKEEYWACVEFAYHRAHVGIPQAHTLKRGGIVGIAYLCGCVKASASPWFTGRYGFKFRDPIPLPFVPCRGELGFFDLKNGVANPFPQS